MKFSFEKNQFIETTVNADKLAVIGSERAITWMDFEAEVDALENFLETNGLSGNKTPVIIYGHKTASMIVAIYTCIKNEIPYIPVDVIYPEDRIKHIVELANVKLIINTTLNGLMFDNTSEILLYKGKVEMKQMLAEKPCYIQTQNPVVYIIFTSGSTGIPKGVQISKESVTSFSKWMCSDFGFTPNDVFINTAILSFDLSVFEVISFAALGGTILLNTKEDIGAPEKLISRIASYHGSVWVSTPSTAFIYSRMKNQTRMDSISSFLFCGEVLPNTLAKNLLLNYPKAKIWNTYGPTEATVATTQVNITMDVVEAYPVLPVGKAKPDTTVIVEENEIMIIGDNVSIGYFKNPKLNKLKFFEKNGIRGFRTGDHGKLENDMLFFDGRSDDLIKLHGYRIELSEITNALNNLSFIQQAATIGLVRNGDVKRIVSLVCSKGGREIIKEEIFELLSQKLPHYMIPSDIKQIDSIPLTSNGKVDNKALLELYKK